MYLCIRNPGVADPRGFTLLGVSTTRDSGHEGTIGQFGSGSKLSISLLLRHEIYPIITCGRLKLSFYLKEEVVKGQTFRRVCVRYSGTDLDGVARNYTEETGFTLGWGSLDWDDLRMAGREILSNAIDSSLIAGASHQAVKIEEVETVRARDGYTQVFLPLTDEVRQMRAFFPQQFLHLQNQDFLNRRCLLKDHPDPLVRVYKKGVLAWQDNEPSVFHYNLADLRLDESRNASEWDVRHAVATAIRKESAETLSVLLRSIIDDHQLWEATLDSYYLCRDDSNEETRQTFQTAWKMAAGPNAVATHGDFLGDFVRNKGYYPVQVPKSWRETLHRYGVPCDLTVLSMNEQKGNMVGEPTQEMVDIVHQVWDLLSEHDLTNGKDCPKVQSFTSLMEGGSQTHGYYIPDGDVVYLHSSLGGEMLFKVALEEVAHYVTGAGDASRDLQDFLFRLIAKLAYTSVVA